MTVLILGSLDDAHACHMLEYLRGRDADVELLDSRWFPSALQLTYNPSTDRGTVRLPAGRLLALDMVRSVYWRCYNLVQPPEMVDPEQAYIACNDSRSLFESLLIRLPVRWINSWRAYQLHQTKPVQLALVARQGVPIPATLLSNDPEAVRDFAARYPRCIFKPVQGGAHTRPLTPGHLSDENLRNLAFSPVTIQEEVPGTNIRVFVAGERVLACEVRTEALDFRDDSDPLIEAHDLPAEVAGWCLQTARLLDLLWTGIDLRRTPEGRYVFLEANPSPMFLGFQSRSGLPLCESLADLLLGNSTVARYFKFHSVDELGAECRRLGLDLRFSDDFAPLFRPVAIGPLRAGNALCIQPMEGCDGTLEGAPDELTFRRYRRFGAGGAKLIWGEAAAVVEEGRANPRQLFICEQTAPGLERMLRECRQAHAEVFGSSSDLIVGLQLTHSGRYSYRRPLLCFHDPLLDPRTVVDRGTGTTIDESYPLITDDDLWALIDRYVEAARLAFRVGFQFVDLKQCHRYLLNELLAARTRPGPFGGSLENRTRLARSVIERIRSEVPGLVLATRLGVFDSIPFRMKPGSDEGEPCPWQAPIQSSWGTSAQDPFKPDLTEPLAWIGEMARLGVALVNVSMGNPYASPHIIRPFEYPPPDGYQTPEHPLAGVERHFRMAGEVQQVFPRLPIVGSGYSYLQEYLFHAAATNVADRRITFVGVGRAALPMPDFARQLQENGRLDRKRVCRTFSYCTALMRSKHNELGQFATGCPPFDKEVYGPIWEVAQRK